MRDTTDGNDILLNSIRARVRRAVPWVGRLRLKALAWVVGISLATIGAITVASLPPLIVVGGAVAAVAVSVTKTANKLMKSSACLHCGADLSDEPRTAYGIACPRCGSISQPRDGKNDLV